MMTPSIRPRVTTRRLTPSIHPRVTTRRHDPRVYVRCPAVVAAGGSTTATSTIDLSCSGACIAYDLGEVALPKGPIRLSLDTGKTSVHLLGLAVWQGPGAYGVRFLVMTDVDRLSIMEIFDHLPTPEREAVA